MDEAKSPVCITRNADHLLMRASQLRLVLPGLKKKEPVIMSICIVSLALAVNLPETKLIKW